MKLKLFFSWQEETDLQGFKNKQFLIGCIQSAIKQIENKGKLKGVNIEFHEGLRGIAGNPSVAAEMYRQIDESDIFIGDMTVAQRLCCIADSFRNKKFLFMRYTPNCNVYGEYNRALGKHSAFSNQIILLQNKANSSVFDDNDVIPFDSRDRRWPIDFTLTSNDKKSEEKAKEDLMKCLPGAIALCAQSAIEFVDNRYWPFVTWYRHRNFHTLSPSRISDDTGDKCRDRIFEKKGTACVIGPKGCTKTEVVLRACRESELANNYLYVDNTVHEYSEYKKTLETIFQKSKDAILVVDNCDEEILCKIMHLRKRLDGGKVIAILDHQLEGKVDLTDYKFYQVDINDLIEQNIETSLDEKGLFDTNVRGRVKEFYEGNVKLISNIDSNVTGLVDARCLTSEYLTNQLLKTEGEDTERIIMRSLALFDFIGWKDDRSDELSFIITEKSITSVNMDDQLLLNKAVSIIKKGLKIGYFESKGRTVSVSPKAMAMQLIAEWLESADEQRLLRAIESIAHNKNGKRLLQEFHDRFRFLGTNEDAVKMVADLLKPGCVFEKMEVLNTNEGAMLLECFAQVNPIAVTDMLARVINSKTQEQLTTLDGGRRYIVWALEKLCFRYDTFKQSAELMLRLANAENEQISNNATGQFIRLFPIMLPATETNLLTRLEFLKEQFAIQQDHSVLMSALKRALTNRDFILFGGAETMGDQKLEPYSPKSYTEISSYFDGCLKILLNEINTQAEYLTKAEEILESTVIALCDGGYASLVLPVVGTVAEKKQFEWDKMRHTLCFFYGKVKNVMRSEDLQLYQELMDKLTKQDPLSRFLRVEKEAFYTEEGIRLNYEERSEKQRATFEALAKEFYDKKLLSRDTLCKLICSENISTYPFGCTLANIMTPDKQKGFVKDMIDAINDSDKPSIDILCQFISVVNDDIFAELIPYLQRSKISYTLFACIGIRNIKPDKEPFTYLQEMVKSGNASVEDYHQYWTRLRIDQLSEDDCVNLFKEILSFKNGLSVVVKMSFFMLMDNKILTYQKIAHLMVQALVSYSEGSFITINLALNVADALLKNLDCPDLAYKVNCEILAFARDSHTSMSHNYELEMIYRTLMSRYFNVIWQDLSNQLLADSDEFMAYYNLKWFLGVDMVDNDNPIINEGNHFEEMKPWIEAHPDIAPLRIASLIQVANEQGDFTPEAMYLIDNFGCDRNVLSELGCSLDSFFSVGSVLPHYEYRKNVYSKLLKHKIEEVRLWAQSQVNTCDYMIAYEGNREEEKI